jgi:hypothetical protein
MTPLFEESLQKVQRSLRDIFGETRKKTHKFVGPFEGLCETTIKSWMGVLWGRIVKEKADIISQG